MPTDPTPAGSIRHPGGRLQPVLLRGRVDHIDGATGELLHRYTTVHEPGGVLPIACKTRRASRCPPCAEVYRADTYQLIRAGLTGGKGIPATVAQHPCVFTSLTGSTAVIAGERINGTTKSGRTRVVSIDDPTVAVLRQHKSNQAADQLKAGDAWRGVKDGDVFTTGWGEPSYPDP